MPQDKTSHHPVLPSLKETHRVGNFSEAGSWVERKAKELENLAAGLNVEKFEFEVNSIPDMWARPLLFEMALRDSSHQVHQRILGEWRGLLAMLALKELRGISDISVKQVFIARPQKDRRGAPPLPKFIEALLKLEPSDTLSTDTSWRELYIILFRKDPIGITSPTTLICTATDCYNRIDSDLIPWFNGRYLRDPKEYLANSHKQALADWLDKLRKNLINHEGFDRNHEIWTQLAKRIDEFMGDLSGATPNAVLLSDIGLGMESGIFVYLDKPVKGAPGDAGQSHVRLLPSRTDAPRKSILVIDKALAQQWGVRAHEILVWGNIPLDGAIPYIGLQRKQEEIAGKKLDHAEAWSPEAFFTDKLFVVGLEDAFPGAMDIKTRGSGSLRFQGVVVTPILPLQKELLDYLSSDDLSERISFEQRDDVIEVRLRLRLSGPDLNGKEFEIIRSFRFKENEVILLNNVPVLEVWPNFKIKEIQTEDQESNGSGMRGQQAAPLNQEREAAEVSISGIQKQEKPKWKAYYTYYTPAGEADTFYAEPYSPGAGIVRQILKSNRGEIEREVIRMSHFPTAMSCRAPVVNPQTDRMETHTAGVILLKQPQETPLPTKSYRIGIDFGATNTNIYAREGEGTAYPVVFNKHFLQVTASGNKRTYLYDDFLPGEVEKTPFLSIFHDFQLVSPGKPLRPLLDGHIYFLLDYKQFQAYIEGIVADLKWSDKSEDRIRTSSFLEQLCLQASAEAAIKGAKEVTWSYSFPTAFSAKARKGFPEIWSQITNSCSALTGLAQGTDKPVEKTESVASALFFKERVNAPTAMGTVCIDIGGSTSDVAIWQDDMLRWQTSLKFAGREMFLNLLSENLSFLNEKFGTDISRLERARGTRSVFYTQADALIRREGDDWLKQLPLHAGDKEVERLTQFIAIGLSGIFYYVGLTLQYLVSTERYRKQIPDVYVGGNASRLFHWLANGAYSSQSDINKLFKAVLLQASHFESQQKDFKVVISPMPKAEAAFGLVCGKNLEFDRNVEEGVLAGEIFLEGNQKRNWDELLIPERLQRGIAVPATLDRFKDFLQCFNKYAASRESVLLPIQVDDITIREIRNRLAGFLSDLTKLDDLTAIQVEPIFILALKSFLDIQSEDWKSRV